MDRIRNKESSLHDTQKQNGAISAPWGSSKTYVPLMQFTDTKPRHVCHLAPWLRTWVVTESELSLKTVCRRESFWTFCK